MREKKEKDGDDMHVLNTKSDFNFLERSMGTLGKKWGKALRTGSDSWSSNQTVSIQKETREPASRGHEHRRENVRVNQKTKPGSFQNFFSVIVKLTEPKTI